LLPGIGLQEISLNINKINVLTPKTFPKNRPFAGHTVALVLS
jgi:hypothetical protein